MHAEFLRVDHGAQEQLPLLLLLRGHVQSELHRRLRPGRPHHLTLQPWLVPVGLLSILVLVRNSSVRSVVSWLSCVKQHCWFNAPWNLLVEEIAGYPV